LLPSPESKSTSDLSLTRDSGILGLKPEGENDRTESKSESSDDKICCGAGNGVLVEDLETMEPESEIDDDNSETKSERSKDRVCC